MINDKPATQFIKNNMSFKETYDAFYSKVVRYISRYVKNSFDVDDITHNVFVHIWLTKKDFFDYELLDSILYKSCRQEIYKWYKAKTEHLPLDHLKDIATSSETEMLDFENNNNTAIDEILTLLQDMPPYRARIFQMKVLKNKSLLEISNELSVSKSAVAKQFNKSVKFLKSNLSSCFF